MCRYRLFLAPCTWSDYYPLPQDEFVEIQTFCLEYSKIKEATALYRLLKSLESGGAEEAAK